MIKAIFGVLLISLLVGCESEKQHIADALGSDIPESVDHLTYDSKDGRIRIVCTINPTDLNEIIKNSSFQREPKLDGTIDFGITDTHVFKGVKILPIIDAQAFTKEKTKLWANSELNRLYLIHEK